MSSLHRNIFNRETPFKILYIYGDNDTLRSEPIYRVLNGLQRAKGIKWYKKDTYGKCFFQYQGELIVVIDDLDELVPHNHEILRWLYCLLTRQWLYVQGNNSTIQFDPKLIILSSKTLPGPFCDSICYDPFNKFRNLICDYGVIGLTSDNNSYLYTFMYSWIYRVFEVHHTEIQQYVVRELTVAEKKEELWNKTTIKDIIMLNKQKEVKTEDDTKKKQDIKQQVYLEAYKATESEIGLTIQHLANRHTPVSIAEAKKMVVNIRLSLTTEYKSKFLEMVDNEYLKLQKDNKIIEREQRNEEVKEKVVVNVLTQNRFSELSDDCSVT